MEYGPHFYETLLSHTEDLVYALDTDFRFIYANAPLLRVWGLSWEEAIGKNLLETKHEPKFAGILSKEFEAVLETRQARRGEIPFKGTIGLRYYEYQLTPVFDAAGVLTAIAGVGRDITERKNAEQHAQLIDQLSKTLINLSSEESLIAAALEAVGQTIGCDRCFFAEFDQRGKHVTLGANWIRSDQTGLQGIYRRSRFGSDDFWKRILEAPLHIPDCRSSGLTKDFSNLLDSFGVRSLIAQPLRREGRRTAVLVATDRKTSTWSTGEQGILENIGSRVWPLVEQVRDTVERRKIMLELERHDAQKDRFLATLSHELRNPLAPVLTGLEIISRSPGNVQLIGQVSEMIGHQMRQMVSLIDDLFDISRIKAGKMELARRRCTLDTVIECAVQSTEKLVRERGHHLTVSMPEGVELNVDGPRLTQVVTNLLENATKYSGSGGEIRLEARIIHSDLAIAVTDKGSGIAPEALGKIFQPYYRVGNSQHEGMGIGLALVRSIIELHGGTVAAFSEGEGHGASFRVRIPDCVCGKMTEESPSATPGIPGPKRVLVVDDSRSAAEILAIFFEGEGMEVGLAYNGGEAIARAKEFKPHCIVMDLGLPDLDGFETARRIKAFDPTISLVALTGWGDQETKRKCDEAGFILHILKPSSPAILRQVLLSI
jgi:PAS domain S-box-containing protein